MISYEVGEDSGEPGIRGRGGRGDGLRGNVIDHATQLLALAQDTIHPRVT
jgi:hypothetical protein